VLTLALCTLARSVATHPVGCSHWIHFVTPSSVMLNSVIGCSPMILFSGFRHRCRMQGKNILFYALPSGHSGLFCYSLARRISECFGLITRFAGVIRMLPCSLSLIPAGLVVSQWGIVSASLAREYRVIRFGLCIRPRVAYYLLSD